MRGAAARSANAGLRGFGDVDLLPENMAAIRLEAYVFDVEQKLERP